MEKLLLKLLTNFLRKKLKNHKASRALDFPKKIVIFYINLDYSKEKKEVRVHENLSPNARNHPVIEILM